MPTDHPRPAAPRTGRWWSLPLRLAVSAAMLWLLLRKIAGVALTDVLPPREEISLPWLVAALGLTAASVVLAAARWTQVLAAMGAAHPPLRRLVSHYFAGQFVSNVLPTTIGGDVLRAARLSADTGQGADSAASLIIERLTGWLVLPMLTAAGLAASPEVRASGHPAVLAAAIAAGTLAALGVILVAADHPRLLGRFATPASPAAPAPGSRAGALAVAARRFLGSVHLGVARLRRHPRPAAGIVAVGVIYQLVLVSAGMAAAWALGFDLAPAAMVAILPVVLMVQVLPVGISGVGLREWSLVLFLSPLGVAHERAVALGLLLFGLNLLVSVLGAPAFLAGGARRAPLEGTAGTA